MTNEIFLSHATLDDRQADTFAAALAEAGFRCWVDHQGGIEPGTPNWERAIQDGIRHCAAGVLLMTPRALASDVCHAECLTLREQGKPLYVAYLETASDIWLTIKLIQYADLRSDFAAGVAALARALRGETGTALPTPVRGKVTGGETLRLHLPYLNTVPLAGREADLKAVRGLLHAHVTQLIAVGGAGKSRLAAEIALTHPTGAVWHRCDETSAAYAVTELIRRHYGLDDKMPAELVLAALDTAPPLVVLDNGEDVPARSDRRAAYAELAGRITAHGAPVLLTSRTAWDELKPFRHHELAPLDSTAAARLALDFATAEGVELAENDAGTLARAARLHPRLIEFAVRQLHRPDGFRRVLRQLEALEHPDVQEALREMIVKTVEQMAAQARQGAEAAALLRRLTVFRGRFDREAAAALRPDGLNTDDGLDDSLDTLQGWGFVRYDRGSQRYTLDDVTRGALPPDDDSRARHFALYRARHGDYDANNDEDRHPLIEKDWDDLRAALEWGSEHQPTDAVDCAWALHYYMRLRVPRAEWQAVMQAAQAAASRTDDRLGQANTLRALGDVAYMEDAYEAARGYYDRALPLYAQIGARLGQANTLRALGDVALAPNASEAARGYYDRALACGEAIGDFASQLNALIGLARLERRLDNKPAACDAFRRLLALADRHPFFKNHPVVEGWREEFAALECP